MQQTNVKEVISESLHLLKEKIVVAVQTNDPDTVDAAIAHLALSVATMIGKLEELAFEAGRLQEDDNSFTFDDFEDFRNS